LIPVDRIKKNEIGNQKQCAPNGVYKKHDHRGMAVDFIMKHMENNRCAHRDVNNDYYGVKNSDDARHIFISR
jgi:hypothetical protein